MYLLSTLHCNGFYLQTLSCHDLAPAASLTMLVTMWNSKRRNCGPYLHVGLVNWPLFISDQLVVCPSSCSAAAERVVLTFSAWSPVTSPAQGPATDRMLGHESGAAQEEEAGAGDAVIDLSGSG